MADSAGFSVPTGSPSAAIHDASSVSAAQTAAAALPFWRAYVHLYLPLVSSALCILIASGRATPVSLIASAVPWTYLVGSFVYGDRSPVPSALAGRFTQQNILYRILVLFTYGRIYGTPFNIVFFALDVLVNWKLMPLIIRENAQRSSHFLLYALWTTASGVIWSFVGRRGILGFILGAIDRTLWRASYLALVDDLVTFLGHPETTSLKGKLTVLGLQAVLISFLIFYTLFRMTNSMRQLRAQAAENLQQAAAPQDEKGDSTGENTTTEV